MNRKKKIPCKVESCTTINGIPHGGRINCGRNPWIYARLVSEFKIATDETQEFDIISWREPPIYRWKDSKQSGFEIDKEGAEVLLKREKKPLLKICVRQAVNKK